MAALEQCERCDGSLPAWPNTTERSGDNAYGGLYLFCSEKCRNIFYRVEAQAMNDESPVVGCPLEVWTLLVAAAETTLRLQTRLRQTLDYEPTTWMEWADLAWDEAEERHQRAGSCD